MRHYVHIRAFHTSLENDEFGKIEETMEITERSHEKVVTGYSRVDRQGSDVLAEMSVFRLKKIMNIDVDGRPSYTNEQEPHSKPTTVCCPRGRRNIARHNSAAWFCSYLHNMRTKKWI